VSCTTFLCYQKYPFWSLKQDYAEESRLKLGILLYLTDKNTSTVSCIRLNKIALKTYYGVYMFQLVIFTIGTTRKLIVRTLDRVLKRLNDGISWFV